MTNAAMLQHMQLIAFDLIVAKEEWTQDEEVLLAQIYVGFIMLSGNGGKVTP